MSRNRRFYDIKFPFTREDDSQGFYLDLNKNRYEAIKSCIIHLIFTPTGQRLRRPQFGSNLVKMLFMPNDELTHSQIKEEVNSSVKKFIPIVDIKNIEGEVDESGRGYRIKINYGISEGNFEVNDEIDINI